MDTDGARGEEGGYVVIVYGSWHGVRVVHVCVKKGGEGGGGGREL